MQKWIVLFKLFLLNTDSFSFVYILDILKLWLAGCLFQYFYFIFLQCTISYKQTILVKTCLCLDLAGAKVSGCNVFKVMSYLDLNNYFTNKLLSDFRVYPPCQFLIKYCISVKMADLFSGLLPRGDEQSPELSMTDSNGEGHPQNLFPFIIFFNFKKLYCLWVKRNFITCIGKICSVMVSTSARGPRGRGFKPACRQTFFQPHGPGNWRKFDSRPRY